MARISACYNMSIAVVTMWLLLGLATATPPTFDGVIRNASDGTLEAYMRPPFKSSHASFIEPCPNGDLVLAWFSGTGEGQSGVSIVVSRLVNGTNQWTDAIVASQRDGFSNQNPVLLYDSQSHQLFLFHSQQPAAKGEDNATIWALQSPDCGITWTQPKLLFKTPGSFDRNRIILSLRNTWLYPIYNSKYDTSYLKVSTTHKVFGDWQEYYFTGSIELIQPTVIRPVANSPKLLAFFRDENQENIYNSTSLDDGVTWSKATKSTLPNNNSGIQATVLQSGHIAMVYNPTRGPRNPLAISVSMDQGQTWAATRNLEYQASGSVEFSYPALIQDGRGRIHVSYTYNRQTIKYKIIPSEQWIFRGAL